MSSSHKSVLLAVALLMVGCGGVQSLTTGGQSDRFPTPESTTTEAKDYKRPFFRLAELPPTLKRCFPEEGSRKGCGAKESSSICIYRPSYEKCAFRALREPESGLQFRGLTPWDYAAIGPDDQTLILAYPENYYRGCGDLRHVEIQEKAQAVVLTVSLGWGASHVGNACPDVLLPAATYLTLSSELGDRQLLDSEPVPEVDEPAPEAPEGD